VGLVSALRIVAPHFVAGVIVGCDAAPIVRYMRAWSERQILGYCTRRGWLAEKVPGQKNAARWINYKLVTERLRP
jgi:hypothetical protein